MDLPTWVQFFLTLAGGFVLGLATAWVAAFRRLNTQEGKLAGIRTALEVADLPRLGERMQSVEETVFGRRGGVGLVHRVDDGHNGIEWMKRALQRIADKLEIELPATE